MSQTALLVAAGILALVTPVAVILREAGRDEADWLMWWSEQPVERIYLLRAVSISGLFLLAAGIVWRP